MLVGEEFAKSRISTNTKAKAIQSPFSEFLVINEELLK